MSNRALLVYSLKISKKNSLFNLQGHSGTDTYQPMASVGKQPAK